MPIRHPLSAAFAGSICLVAGCAATGPIGDPTYCNMLSTQFERYSNTSPGGFTPGKLQRDIGVDLCSRGNTADGERELQQALWEINIPPVSRPTPPAAR